MFRRDPDYGSHVCSDVSTPDFPWTKLGRSYDEYPIYTVAFEMRVHLWLTVLHIHLTFEVESVSASHVFTPFVLGQQEMLQYFKSMYYYYHSRYELLSETFQESGILVVDSFQAVNVNFIKFRPLMVLQCVEVHTDGSCCGIMVL
ncbi:hypothetical protein C5167_033946 [Papaver somniferum]|uniref:Uncharacterized protein n=1 Tax=Papaver somniferum TaxID=3469 RepID=A0A4Y7KF58_PAPSO|nr:hypothetical protein C5167_033946 [Papaver somniferum]